MLQGILGINLCVIWIMLLLRVNWLCWPKMKILILTALEDKAYDDFMGLGSGAGVIFGNTGGVMEAAVRVLTLL